jgi:hypothetical protein
MRVSFFRLVTGAAVVASLSVAACGDDEGANAGFGRNTGGAAGGFAGDSGTQLGTGGTANPSTGGVAGAAVGTGGRPAGGSAGSTSTGGRTADAATDASPESGGSTDAARDGASPTGCQASVDCPAGAPVCHVSNGLCRECNSNTQCPPTAECVNGACVPFKTCTNSVGCVGNAGGRTICDQQNGVCVECNVDADCLTQGKVCSSHRCLTGCTTDNQCTSAGLLCNPSSGACTECVQTADCAASEYCDKGTCVPDTCVAGARTCSGNAVYACNTTGSAVSLVEKCGRRSSAAADAGAVCGPAPGDGGSPTGDSGSPPADAGLPSHCASGTRDSDESDVDCGGADCARCAEGDACRAGTDCATLSCGAPCFLPLCQLTRVCLQPTCTDAVKNGQETGPDCGGPTCGKCPGGEACKVNADCASNVCTGGTCEAPNCVVSQCPACTLQVKCCTAQDTCGCAPARGGTCG